MGLGDEFRDDPSAAPLWAPTTRSPVQAGSAFRRVTNAPTVAGRCLSAARRLWNGWCESHAGEALGRETDWNMELRGTVGGK